MYNSWGVQHETKDVIIEIIKELEDDKLYDIEIEEYDDYDTSDNLLDYFSKLQSFAGFGEGVFEPHKDYRIDFVRDRPMFVSLPNLPTQVFFNKKKKATTLLFDEEAFVVKCDKKDKYNKRIGFLEAYFQAHSGLSKTQANKYLKEVVEDD